MASLRRKDAQCPRSLPRIPPLLKWIPKGMDPNSACRLAIRVPAYVEQRPDGLGDRHVTENWLRVVDKDRFNWMGFHELLGQEIVHGQDQGLQVTFFDKNKDETTRINSDSSLLHAFDVYWDVRKLPLTVEVVDTRPWDSRTKQWPDSNAKVSADATLDVAANHDDCMPLDMVLPYHNLHNAQAEANNTTDAIPRKRMIVGVEEGGSSSKGKRRCGGLGHLQKTCNETIHDPDAPSPAPPKKKRTYKTKVVEIIQTTNDPSKKKKKKRKAPTKGKHPNKKKKATLTEPTTNEQVMQVPNSLVTRRQTKQVAVSRRPVSRSLATSTGSPSASTRSKKKVAGALGAASNTKVEM